MLAIHRWQHHYLGTNNLPPALPPLELQAFFTFSPQDLAALRKFDGAYRVGAALQLGFIRLSGNLLGSTEVVTRELVEHLAVLTR